MSEAYGEGEVAAALGLPRYCPYPATDLYNRCQWLAGHYDKSKEINHEKSLEELRATQRAANSRH